MSASISSVIAQIVMEDLEKTVHNNTKIKIPFFYRYVDDCITAVPKDAHEIILYEFNNYNQKLQFAIEVEEENKISFMDMNLYHI